MFRNVGSFGLVRLLTQTTGAIVIGIIILVANKQMDNPF